MLKLKEITKTYQTKDLEVQALKGISLTFRDNEFVSILGPSGCGKSTTLRMIAGLEEISKGELYIGDRLVNDIAPKDRDIAMVFQNYALYPHMTVYENMAFGLKLRKVPKDEIDRKVKEAAKILDLSHLLDRNPQVFLLDEPLSNLDAKLRAQMRTEISKLHKKLGTTFIYVTHDQTEAMTLGDRIVVMKDGIIQQIDTPQNLYERPGNKFVAGFLGSPQMNFIDGVLKKKNNGYCVQFAKKYELAIPAAKEDKKLTNYVDKEVVLGIRPEAIHDDEMFLSTATTGIIECDVDITEMMGAENFLYLDCQGTPLTARVDPRSTAKQGDKNLKVALDPNRMHLFDKETEETIIN